MSTDVDMRVSFDPDYDDMIAELYWEGRCVCLISQERGADTPDITFFEQPRTGTTIDLAAFLDAVSNARRRLQQLRPLPSPEQAAPTTQRD